MLPLLTVDEAAERLGRTPASLRAAARDGLIPWIRLGRDMRFESDAVDRFAREEEAERESRRPGSDPQMPPRF